MTDSPNENTFDCDYCNGTGTVTIYDIIEHVPDKTEPCYYCDGTGKSDKPAREPSCPECDGAWPRSYGFACPECGMREGDGLLERQGGGDVAY